jgi:hypothetical protein
MPDKHFGELDLAGADLDDSHFGLQRFAWGVMALLVALTMAGAFGGGWLAQARVASADARLHIDYDRLARADAPTQLRLSIRPSPADRGEVELTFPSQYLEQMQVETIVPPPLRARSGSRGITYAFGVATEGAPAVVVLTLMPRRAGWVDASVALGGAVPVAFGQVIFP